MEPASPCKAIFFFLLDFTIKGPHLKVDQNINMFCLLSLCWRVHGHLKKNTNKLFITAGYMCSFDYFLFLPLFLVLVLVFVCAAIFVLHLFPLPVSVFFVRRVPVHLQKKKGQLNSTSTPQEKSWVLNCPCCAQIWLQLAETCIQTEGLPIAVLWFLPLLIFFVVLVFVLLVLVFVFMLVGVWKKERHALDSTMKTHSRVTICWDVRICYSARAKSKMTTAGSTLKWRGQTINTPTSESSETNQPTSWRSVKICPRCCVTQSRNQIS